MNKKDEKIVNILDGDYLIPVRCTNCGKLSTASIKKGFTIEEAWITEPVCPKCGCATLEKYLKEC